MVDYRGDDPGIIMGNKNGDGVIEPPMNSMKLWRVFPYPLVNQQSYGKSPLLMGKSTISTGPFSIANC